MSRNLKISKIKSYILVSLFISIGGTISAAHRSYSKYINTTDGIFRLLVSVSIMFFTAFIISFGFFMVYDYFSKKAIKKNDTRIS